MFEWKTTTCCVITLYNMHSRYIRPQGWQRLIDVGTREARQGICQHLPVQSCLLVCDGDWCVLVRTWCDYHPQGPKCPSTVSAPVNQNMFPPVITLETFLEAIPGASKILHFNTLPFIVHFVTQRYCVMQHKGSTTLTFMETAEW